MISHFLPESDISAKDNLRWLFLLRNLIILSVLLVIILSVYGFSIDLPKESLGLVLISIISFNVFTGMRLKTDPPVTEFELFSHLVLDALSIALLLYFTGGASNPLSWLFLFPLIITAIILPQTYTWSMLVFTSSLYTFLIGYYVPLPDITPNLKNIRLNNGAVVVPNDLFFFDLQMFGMWFGFVFGAAVVAYFVTELSKTLRERERNLAEVRENTLRDERLVALGTLAAGAAHEIGTPLGTMAIVTHEIQNDYPLSRFPDLHQKTQLILEQIQRCKKSLSIMSSSSGELRAESGQLMLVITYLDEVINQWRTQKPGGILNLSVNDESKGHQCQVIAEKTLTHSLINILNNAIEASPPNKGIDLAIRWDTQFLVLEIRDYGKGVSSKILEQAQSEPVVSQKQGLGVGLFLTYASIKRLGGNIKTANNPTCGVITEITLPLIDTGNNNE